VFHPPADLTKASLNSRTLVRSAKSYASVYNQNSILI
jgi:hypothetical protein